MTKWSNIYKSLEITPKPKSHSSPIRTIFTEPSWHCSHCDLSEIACLGTNIARTLDFLVFSPNCSKPLCSTVLLLCHTRNTWGFLLTRHHSNWRLQLQFSLSANKASEFMWWVSLEEVLYKPVITLTVTTFFKLNAAEKLSEWRQSLPTLSAFISFWRAVFSFFMSEYSFFRTTNSSVNTHKNINNLI